MGLIIDNGRDKQAENNSEFAYRILRDNIMRMRLEPGETLNEAELTAELGISRTPVREALFKLKEENLVEIIPHKASRVTQIDFVLVHEGLFARTTVEPLVTTMACGNLDAHYREMLEQNLTAQEMVLTQGRLSGDLHAYLSLDQRFHELIFESCGMHAIWKCVLSICTHYERLRYFDVISGTVQLEGHMQIYNALVAGDTAVMPDLTRSQMFKLESIWQYLRSEHRRYFKDLIF